jgi:hypothetical protein
MSHNDPTLSRATERRTGVTLVAAVPPANDVGMRLLSGHFDIGVQPNLPEPLRMNKTIGLVTREGSEADGD